MRENRGELRLKTVLKIGDVLRRLRSQLPEESWETVRKELTDFVRSEHTRFNEKHWNEYLNGPGGPDGPGRGD
jgi:hypothetical protein